MTNHSLNTVISSTMQAIQPKSEGILQDFSAINEWYSELDKRYHFSSHGYIVTALSSEAHLERLSKLDTPIVSGGLKVKGKILKVIETNN